MRITSFCISFALLLVTIAGFGQKTTINYLALGDSYTIGESVDENERWPIQLANKLSTADSSVKTEIIAKTGWRTDDLLNAIENQSVKETYDLVSLLIGVNNQYQGRPFEQYKTELIQLIVKALEFTDNDTSQFFVVSIPDYFHTPFGQENRTNLVSRDIDTYNDYARQVCDSLGITYINITEISRKGVREPKLVAEDDLHPSPKQYKRWVEKIYTELRDPF